VKEGGVVRGFSVSPSPFRDEMKVSFSVTVKQVAVFKLVSSEGKTVFVDLREVRAGLNQFVFKLPPLSTGLYVMTITNDEGTVGRKVIKE